MNRLPVQGRTLALFAVLVPLLLAFVYVALRSGPLAPVPVTVTTVENRALVPFLFGVGTVEARSTYRIGPTVAARVKRVEVDVGEQVRAGQVLGDMDPVDLDDRIVALDMAARRATAQSSAAVAQVRDAEARRNYTETQVRRYEQLGQAGTISQEELDAKRQEGQMSDARLAVARAEREAARLELARIRADHDALTKQRLSLRLVAPADGLVVMRNAEPGTTVVAGQPVVEVVDPGHLWVNVRFDQVSAYGLQTGLPARITLRSQGGSEIAGHVVRVEPLADSVTEEILAKVAFDTLPPRLPPIGELAEITATLPALAITPTVPNACVQQVNGRRGVWLLAESGLQFAPVETGEADMEGRMQILDGLQAGDRVVMYSRRMLDPRSRIKVVERLPEGRP